MKMAHNKMEKDFSKKLNEREIQPSPMAWDRLDAMLAVAEEKKAGKKYNWLYVAAGFLGFLFIGTMLFNQTEEMTDARRNEVVIENKAEEPVKTLPNPESIQPVYENKIHGTAIASEGKTQMKSSEGTVKVVGPKQGKQEIILQNPRERVAENNPKQTSQNPEHQSQSIISQKTEQITTATYVNVDDLLASVEKSPKTKKPTIKVDPNSLLSQVDGELELSFREKVIQAANKQYKNVKVALSNRNVQE